MNINVFCSVVEDQLNRKLYFDEKELIKGYISQIKLTPHTSLKLAFKYHVQFVCRKLSKHLNGNLHENLREQQIAMLGKTEEEFQLTPVKHSADLASVSEVAKLEAMFLLEVSDVYDLSKAIAPKSKLKYNYLMLDSDNCFDINGARDKFTWLLQEEHTNLQTGYINLHAKLRNVVMARLGRVTFAHMHEDFTNAVINRNRFGFGFEEFTSQALITPYGTKFQFIEFMSESDRNYGTTCVLSAFNANRGWFRFREPFKMLDKLTLTITNLNTSTKITVPDTAYSFSALNYSNRYNGINSPVYISGGDTKIPINYYMSEFGVEYDNPISTQNPYLISGYSSGNPVVDATWNGTRNLTFSGLDPVLYNPPDWFNPIGTTVGPFVGVGPYIEIPFTVTLMYLPRFTGVLELISDGDIDDNEDEY